MATIEETKKAQGYESIMDRIYRYDIEPNIEAW